MFFREPKPKLYTVLHLLQQHSLTAMLNLTCLQIRPFTNQKHLMHHKVKNTTKKMQDCYAAIILFAAIELKIIQYFSHKRTTFFLNIFSLFCCE